MSTAMNACFAHTQPGQPGADETLGKQSLNLELSRLVCSLFWCLDVWHVPDTAIFAAQVDIQ